MKSKTSEIEIGLMKQLERKGIAESSIPLFIKDMVNAVYVNSSLEGLSQINDHLRLLGWTDFELDYHTFQLAKACFENWRD